MQMAQKQSEEAAQAAAAGDVLQSSDVLGIDQAE